LSGNIQRLPTTSEQSPPATANLQYAVIMVLTSTAAVSLR